MNLNDLSAVVCRPALPKDTPDVLEFTRRTWEGHDYVPQAWAGWLADPQGVLASAELDGRVVGIAKLTRLSGEQWWLEGLRVNPDYEGQKIASHLHEYISNYWERRCGGILRFLTWRPQVRHLAERTGFTNVCQFSPFEADGIPGEPAPFTPIALEEAQSAADLARRSPSVALSAGFMDLGWEWASPSPDLLEPIIRRSQAWWWRDHLGLLALHEDDEDEIVEPWISLAACALEDLPALLLDYRRLASSLGYGRAHWTAPMRPEVESILASTGFQRGWDQSVFLYEKRGNVV